MPAVVVAAIRLAQRIDEVSDNVVGWEGPLSVRLIPWQGGGMEIMEWWPKLDADAQGWLIAHNGEAVAPGVLSKIVTAGGSVNSHGWWIGSSGDDGFYLSDKAVDWIEMRANDETE